MSTLQQLVLSEAVERDGKRTLSVAATRDLSVRLGVSRRSVEVTALRAGVLPLRYERNLGTIGWEGQAKLLESCAAVVGCGGLGGHIAEGLARMGVGRLILVDFDVFDDNNLNRQLLCTEDNLGHSKVAVAASRVKAVNGAVETTVHAIRAGDDEFRSLLDGAHVVLDALDTVSARFSLERATQAAGVPLIHGAIAGFAAQATTIYPGDRGLRVLYGSAPEHDRGVEAQVGNLTATPMLCAAIQVQEAIKVLLGIGSSLRNKMLYIDTESWQVHTVSL